MCVCVWACVCECSDLGGQERALDSLKLQLQVFVNHPMWVLGTEPR